MLCDNQLYANRLQMSVCEGQDRVTRTLGIRSGSEADPEKVGANRTHTKSIYERELMANVLAVQQLRLYLLVQKFLFWTDHQALKHLLEQHVIRPKYHKWISKLLG